MEDPKPLDVLPRADNDDSGSITKEVRQQHAVHERRVRWASVIWYYVEHTSLLVLPTILHDRSAVSVGTETRRELWHLPTHTTDNQILHHTSLMA